MSRPMLWPDKILAPLPEGSFDRMRAVMAPGETKADFLREATRRELERREDGGTGEDAGRNRQEEGAVLTLAQILASLPEESRLHVERRSAELIEKERIRRAQAQASHSAKRGKATA